MNVIALIPAAGAGKRMGGDRSKQYLEVGGRPILAHTLEVFDRCDAVSEVCLIVPEEDCSYACEMLDSLRFLKPVKVVPGGKERQDSVRNGLNSIYNCDIVLGPRRCETLRHGRDIEQVHRRDGIMWRNSCCSPGQGYH